MQALRLGKLFSAEDGPDWMHSHATYPTPLILEDGTLRLFLVSRGADNLGRVGWIDLDPTDLSNVLQISDRAALEPGALGAFDDRGIAIGSVHRIGRELWLYYMGWNKAADVPFRNAIGLAISRDGRGDCFERVSEGPILDRNRFDPFTLSYPFVVPPVRAGDDWLMYYGTNRAGGDREETMQHELTFARSRDGIDWGPSGETVIGLKPGEFGISRPWLLTQEAQELLFFSIRRSQYAIGVATRSAVGQPWQRLTSDLLGSSADTWDNAANCYPAAITLAGRHFLFYSGNQYGKTGLGVASLTD